MADQLQPPIYSEESTEAVTAGPSTQFDFDLDTDLYNNTNLDTSLDPALQNSEFNTDSPPPNNAEMYDNRRQYGLKVILYIRNRCRIHIFILLLYYCYAI
jgi:hypothetical protein